VIESFGVRHMQYADDTTLYVALEDANTVPVLSDCFRAVHHWLDLNGLSLNTDKTEAIVIGTSSRQASESPVTSVDLGDVSVQTSDCVKTLGVILDDTLNFNKHVNAVCQSANYHLRALRHIRKLVSEETAKTVACSMVQGELTTVTLSCTRHLPPIFTNYSAGAYTEITCRYCHRDIQT